MAHPMTQLPSSDRFPQCVCSGLAATAERVQHLHTGLLWGWGALLPALGQRCCPGWEGTLGAPMGRCSPLCSWEVRGQGDLRALGLPLGMEAGCWSPARCCLEAGVMLPDTDLQDPALLLPRKGGPQSCSQCCTGHPSAWRDKLHRVLIGSGYHGCGTRWLLMASDDCLWHPERVTPFKRMASQRDWLQRLMASRRGGIQWLLMAC